MENMQENTENTNVQDGEGPASYEILSKISDGLFDQIVEYTRNIRPDVTKESAAVMVLDIAFAFLVLDPVVKKELQDMLRELREVVKGGALKGFMNSEDFRKNVAAYISRTKGPREVNEYALQQLINYLGYDMMVYGKEE